MKKRILSFVLTALFITTALSVTAGAAKTPFSDVRDKDWFSSDVQYVYENNIMNGTSKTTFEPKTALTRAMYVTIIFRLSGAEGTYSNKFLDVPAGKWYSDAVGWAQNTGIVAGYSDGKFHGNNKITRQEMAVMTARYLNWAWADLPDSDSAVAKYADESKIAKWAKPSFDTVRRIGLILGDQNGNANPSALATRAETAALIGRLHKSLQAVDKTPRIGGNPLDGYTVCSDFMRENELNDLRDAVNEAAGVELPTAATADGRKIVVREDDSLERLSYTLKEENGDLVLTLFSKYAADHAAEIIRSEAARRSAFTIPAGFSTDGTFLLDELTEPDGAEFMCETDKNPLCYRVGDTVTYRCSVLKNGRLVSVPNLKWEYANDSGRSLSGSEPGYAGQIILEMPGCTAPGQGILTVKALSRKGYSFAALDGLSLNGGVLFNAEEIRANLDMPADFDEFWDGVAEQIMAAEPAVEEYYEPASGYADWNVYSLRVDTGMECDPAYITVTVPKNAEPGSLGIRAGYDGYGFGSTGYNYSVNDICIKVNPHSFENDRDEAFYVAKAAEIGEFQGAGTTREDSYFLGMLIRDVQAIRLVEKEFAEYWNGRDITVSGGSMGGFQAVAVAALYPKVTRVESGITWMCDLGGQSEGGTRIRGWRPDYTASTAYYDTCYFAHRVTCPTAVSAALGDMTCPCCGVTAMYNSLGGVKSLSFKQNATHGYGGGAYNSSYYVEGELTGLDPMEKEIPVTGIAVYIPYGDDDRVLTPEEEAVAAITKKLEKAALAQFQFAASTEITEEFVNTWLKNELVTKYGLSADCTVEVDRDQLFDIRYYFTTITSGGSAVERLEYTVTLPSGGFVDSYFKTMMIKK